MFRTAGSDAVPRSKSHYGSKSYRDALQRAFNRAKQQIFFNPDMQYFVTLTYKGLETDIDKAMHDVKMLVKAEKRKGNDLKYIYVFEWQKRGSLHIHMITNSALTTYINKNNHPSLTYWPHGFTSMLTIKDFDNNFRPHLYLFKYMRKAERIGKSFIHSSRNLNQSYRPLTTDERLDYSHWRTINQEHITTTVQTTQLTFIRNYLHLDVILFSDDQSSLINKGNKLCHKQIIFKSSSSVQNLLKQENRSKLSSLLSASSIP